MATVRGIRTELSLLAGPRQDQPPLARLVRGESVARFKRRYRWRYMMGRRSEMADSPERKFALTATIKLDGVTGYKYYPPQKLTQKHEVIYYRLASQADNSTKRLARLLYRLAQKKGFGPYQTLCFMLAFVREGIRYVSDQCPKTGKFIDFPKCPFETLIDGEGDCEDQAILAAALLSNVGYRVALIGLPGHLALGVADVEGLTGLYLIDPATGRRYYFVETTTPGSPPGAMPSYFNLAIKRGVYELWPIN